MGLGNLLALTSAKFACVGRNMTSLIFAISSWHLFAISHETSRGAWIVPENVGGLRPPLPQFVCSKPQLFVVSHETK